MGPFEMSLSARRQIYADMLLDENDLLAELEAD